MRMLALLELEFGSGLFNRLTELRWQSECLQDREIEKLFGKQPCEGNQHNRILSRRIARSWLFGIQRLFHNFGNNIRGASCFFVFGERGRHSAKTYGIQTGSFRRQRSDLLFDAAKGFLNSGRIDRTRLHDDDVDALGAQLQPQRRTEAKAALELASTPANGGLRWSTTEHVFTMRPFALRNSGRNA